VNAEEAIGTLRSVPAASELVRRIELRPDELALCTLERIDYYDAFLAETAIAERGTGEDWARAVLEGAPLQVRSALLAGWTGLGLKLGAVPAQSHVLGWELKRSDGEHALLAAGSRLGMPAELLLGRRPGGLFLATFVRHENAVASKVWAGIAPVHRRVVPHVLELAAGAGSPG